MSLKKYIFGKGLNNLSRLPYGKVIHQTATPLTDFVGTPNIVKMPSGRIITAHDIYGASAVNFGKGYVYVSDDQGKTFTNTFSASSLFWMNLFKQGSDLYMVYITGFDTSYSNGNIAIRKSTDEGNTWSSAVTLFSDDGTFGGYLMHANPVMERDGYISMAVMKNTNTPNFASSYQVGILYGNVVDLMNPLNWALSSFLTFNGALLPVKIYSNTNQIGQPKGNTMSKGHLEAQIVYDGTNTYLHCRLEQTPNSNYGVYYVVTWNSVVPATSTISTTPNYNNFLGGHLKSQITWDATTSKFWALASWNRFKYMSDNRSETYLISSSNFTDWSVNKKVAGFEITSSWESEITSKGSQYSAFVIDGDNIFFATRSTTASGSTAHDADALTLSKIDNFRSIPNISFVSGAMIIDENSQRLETGSGIGVILDQSINQNSPYMLTADNASKVSWSGGLNFTGSKYLRVPHNEFLNPNTGTGISFFVVIENLQSTAGLRILSKAASGSTGIASSEYSFSPEGMQLQGCFTSYSDLVTTNNYILASSYDNATNRIWNYRNGVNRGLPTSTTGGTWSVDHINVTTAYTSGNINELYIGKRNYNPSPLFFTSKIKAIHIIPSFKNSADMITYMNALNAIYAIY